MLSYVVLGIKPRASGMKGYNSINTANFLSDLSLSSVCLSLYLSLVVVRN